MDEGQKRHRVGEVIHVEEGQPVWSDPACYADPTEIIPSSFPLFKLRTRSVGLVLEVVGDSYKVLIDGQIGWLDGVQFD